MKIKLLVEDSTLDDLILIKLGEKYEKFQMTVRRKSRTFYHYDYRDTADNELFSCVKPTLEECRQKRDEWLIQKQRKYMTEQ
jgi:hypothetical protein